MVDLSVTLVVGVMSAGGVMAVVLVTLVGHLLKRVADLEAGQLAIWAARENDAITKRAQGDHIDVLEDHIWKGKGPPPPPRPVGV